MVVPTAGVVPNAGVYTKVPGMVEVASSCATLSVVPEVMAAGVAQLTAGVALFTVKVTVLVAVVK